jgi:glycosyltransferase involved in cell wall biosynthesis
MLNFAQIIALAAETVGGKPILAAPYPLPSIVCRNLLARGLIGGVVVDSVNDAPKDDPLVSGWWIDREQGSWFLRRGSSRSVLLLSFQAVDEIGGGMLLEARLKGITRIFLISNDGSVAEDVNVTLALLRRLGRQSSAVSYDGAFDEMYALLGERLRLPRQQFDPDRILVVSGSLEGGGAERQATYTALGLAKRFPGKVMVAVSRAGGNLDFYKPALDQAQVPVFALREDEEYSSTGIAQIRNVLATNYLKLGFLDIFYMIFNHAMLLQELKPGLVHTFQDYSNILVGVAADLVGVPRLVLAGRSVAPDNFAFFQPYMAPGYKTLLQRRKVAFLNNSETGAKDYARWLGIHRGSFRIVKNGFDFPSKSLALRLSQRRALNIPESAIVIGTVIGFREEKRPELFIEMARLLHAKLPQAHFVIFGGGSLFATCQEFIESHGLVSFIHTPGPTDDVWAALSSMDIFVLTSRIEGLPNVMIEAQAMALPVVCTAVGGMPETYVEAETGFGVHAASAEALARCVERIAVDPELRQRMGAAACKHARKTFSIERMIDLTLEAYGSVPPAARGPVRLPDWRLVNLPTEIKVGGAVSDKGCRFRADLPADCDASALRLWEDDEQLTSGLTDDGDGGPSEAGNYAIDGNKLLFCASDASDVRFNGRAYRLRPKDAEPDFDEIIISPETISQEIGHCFLANLGLSEGSGRVGLWEDEVRLGPGGCLHDDVRINGGGRYSVWGPTLYFSSTDNTDPRSNGRGYRFRRARKAEASLEQIENWKGARLERAFRRMLANALPRDDFIPGRVVHVIGSLGPGGAERQTLYTLRGLKQHSVESVQLLCYFLGSTGDHRHDFYLPALSAAGIPVRTVRRDVGDNDPGSFPAGVQTVWQALPPGLAADIADLFWEFIYLRPEIVHAWLDGTNYRAALAAALAGVPHIVVSGRNVNPTHFDYLYEPCTHPAYKALLELPQITMVNNSCAGRDDYAQWLGISPDRISVIHNGCDFPTSQPDDIRRKAREAYDIPADAILIGTATRLSEEKRPDLFVEMARHALAKQNNLRFVLFGTGPLRDKIQTQVEALNLTRSVKLMGVTDDIWTSLAAMDIFVLASRMEGLPNVLIEAQCAGVPVVATNVGGAPEAFVHGKTGLGVATPSAETLAEAVLRLAGDAELRKQMSLAAAAFARSEFAVPRMIARTLELYKAIGIRSL